MKKRWKLNKVQERQRVVDEAAAAEQFQKEWEAMVLLTRVSEKEKSS
jgi:hypothetical protein